MQVVTDQIDGSILLLICNGLPSTKLPTLYIVVKNTKSFIYLPGSRGTRIVPWVTVLNKNKGPPPNSACNIKQI